MKCAEGAAEISPVLVRQHLRREIAPKKYIPSPAGTGDAFAHRMGRRWRVRPDEGKRRTNERRGEKFNNQVPEILSRSRKVRTQIPNKSNFVATATTGAKGQRPTQGRAGAGFWKLVLTLALTFYPLPQERKSPLDDFVFSEDRPANPVAGYFKTAANVKSLSPWGEGWVR